MNILTEQFVFILDSCITRETNQNYKQKEKALIIELNYQSNLFRTCNYSWGEKSPDPQSTSIKYIIECDFIFLKSELILSHALCSVINEFHHVSNLKPYHLDSDDVNRNVTARPRIDLK